MVKDEVYMKRAIELAKLASGHTSPNPLVGAVIVKDDCIVGEGFHHKAGTEHAEVHALDMADDNAKGATLYVTLEPCAHYGRTPPCALRVIESGVARVVIGSVDPNPKVSGKGIQLLRNAGIEVVMSTLERDCVRLNEPFFTMIQTGKPYVTLKMAMSLDGKIATKTGQSQWITSEGARKDGHRLRGIHDAMLVGIGTILADKPSLNCRLTATEWYDAIIDRTILSRDEYYMETIQQPHVIIMDSHGRTPLEGPWWIVPDRNVFICVSPQCDPQRIQALEHRGATVIIVPHDEGTLSIDAMLLSVSKYGINSILVEGGSHIISSFLDEQCFDGVVAYIGNQCIGSTQGLSVYGGKGISQLRDAVQLAYAKVDIIDGNVRIEGERVGRKGAYVYRNH